jgi:hypothetical protein
VRKGEGFGEGWERRGCGLACLLSYAHTSIYTYTHLYTHTRTHIQTHNLHTQTKQNKTAAAIRDSNRPTLLSLYRRLLGDDARVVDLGIVRDVDGVEALAKAIRGALERWV